MRIISASEKMITFRTNFMRTGARSFDVKLSVDPEERNKSDFLCLINFAIVQCARDRNGYKVTHQVRAKH